MTELVVITSAALATIGFIALGFAVWVLLHAMERSNSAWRIERERLITGCIEPTALVSMNRTTAIAAQAAARLATAPEQAKMDELERRRAADRFEPVGGAV